ncbi:MAG: ABC transporter permease [Gracilibacter sp. BRH_c7a]|nr:MAG: ABC transporter permease [Gracilibacter sp. BRH_c7a]
MTSNLSVTNLNTLKENEHWDMDGFIKFILATGLASMGFFFEEQMSFGILSIYLLIVTLVLRIKFRTLLLSAASYCVIVLIPFLFGILMNSVIFSLTNNELFVYNQGSYELVLRLFRLFLIWYVSILYFHTTPLKTIIGLLDKLFFPLKLLGVPVKDYLKIVMCIVLDLKGTGVEMKNKFLESARSSIGGTKGKFKINIKGISQIIVSLLVNSFEKIDKIQKFVEEVNTEDLYHYSFKISKRDVVAVLSFVLFTSAVIMIEKGYWF